MGYIYKIIINDKFYIGSTRRRPKDRLREHKSRANKKYDWDLYNYINDNNIQWDTITYEILEENEINTDKELKEVEKKYIKEYLDQDCCLNMTLPNRSDKEYRCDYKEILDEKKREYYNKNKDILVDRAKKYYEDNRSKVLDRHKKKVECECGFISSNYNIKRHQKSKIHFVNLDKKKI